MAPADLSFLADDPHNVVGVLFGEIRVGVVERSPHLIRVLLVDAEDDRLCPSVRSTQVLGEMLRCGLGSAQQGHDSLEFPGRIEALRDLLAEEVELSLIGRPAVRVGAEDDAAHPVGREESVLDALCEGILEQGVAEVLVAVDRLIALRGGRHSELGRGREVVQDCPPR